MLQTALEEQFKTKPITIVVSFVAIMVFQVSIASLDVLIFIFTGLPRVGSIVLEAANGYLAVRQRRRSSPRPFD